MGYFYDMLKQALGGSKMSNSHSSVVKDWSPNNVKALMITRDFILVAYHIKPPKLYPLDTNEVAMDLQRNGSQGALHNLLGQRQLSCMEEFYADSIFRQYMNAFNMNMYIVKLLNERSRLRYYGYVEGAVGQEVYEKYRQAQINSKITYAYALDESRGATLQYTSVENNNWYKNYNLRPQYYAMDAEKGKLHTWFVKCEKDIDKYASENKQRLLEAGMKQGVTTVFMQDLELLPYLTLLLEYKKYLKISKQNRQDRVVSSIYKSIDTVLGNKLLVKGLTVKLLHENLVLKSDTQVPASILLKAYSRLGVIDREDSKELSLEEITEIAKVGDGFLNLSSRLDDMCVLAVDLIEKSFKEGMLLVYSAAMECEGSIPPSKLATRLNLQGNSTVKSPTEGYIKFLLAICGWTVESFNNYSGRKR